VSVVFPIMGKTHSVKREVTDVYFMLDAMTRGRLLSRAPLTCAALMTVVVGGGVVEMAGVALLLSSAGAADNDGNPSMVASDVDTVDDDSNLLDMKKDDGKEILIRQFALVWL